MKLVHMADQHLGFRQYGGVAGVKNEREQDVMNTFRHAVDRIIDIRPDVIAIAGDLFHTARPTNHTIIDAVAEFRRLVAALPATEIILVAGNHDMPKTKDSASILQLLAQLGIHVVEWEAQRLAFPKLELSVLAVPDAPGMTRPELTPDTAARFNLMILHGEVQGMMRRATGHATKEISSAELRAAEWTYCALGHYHVYREIAPNCYYSGSIDYTSSNPWGELDEEREFRIPGKGFIERDLVTGVQTFHQLPASRQLLDWSFSAFEMSAADVDEAIQNLVNGCQGGIDEKIVRLVITDIPKEVSRELDPKPIRTFKRGALNFNLSFRRPEVIQAISAGGVRRARTLEERLGEFFARRFADDPELGAQIAALSKQYMDKATEKLDGSIGVAALTNPGEAAA